MRPGFRRILIVSMVALIVAAFVVGQQRRARIRQTIDRVHKRMAIEGSAPMR
jgi:hypothetical protein